jgi:hypothetical protein
MTDKELLWGALGNLECELANDHTPCGTCLYAALRQLNEFANRREAQADRPISTGKEVAHV